MKRAISLFLIAFVLLTFAGVALAMEMSGTVTSVDAQKGVLKLKNEKVEVGFDCETGSMIKDIKVGDKVTVEYKEAGGKKKATKVSPAATKKKAPVGC